MRSYFTKIAEFKKRGSYFDKIAGSAVIGTNPPTGRRKKNPFALVGSKANPLTQMAEKRDNRSVINKGIDQGQDASKLQNPSTMNNLVSQRLNDAKRITGVTLNTAANKGTTKRTMIAPLIKMRGMGNVNIRN